MKKLCLLLVLFSVFACESDDNEGVAVNEANLEGKWYFISSRVGDNDYVIYNSNCTSKPDYMELSENSVSMIVKHYSNCETSTGNTPATWSLNGKTFTYTDSNPDAEFGGNFEVKVLSDYNLSLIQTVILDDEDATVQKHIFNFKRD